MTDLVGRLVSVVTVGFSLEFDVMEDDRDISIDSDGAGRGSNGDCRRLGVGSPSLADRSVGGRNVRGAQFIRSLELSVTGCSRA